jgi:trehalose 6-phosphate synthase/phosphatase
MCSIVLVGKKNLEVRPMAINKGEIVKRILYLNPDAQFVFCAGDDKVRLANYIFSLVDLTLAFLPTRQTDEDMFRSLQFTEASLPYTMDPPLSVSLVSTEKALEKGRVELLLTPEDIFTTAVGHPSKRTLAKWHVTSPLEVVAELLKLAGVAAKDESSEPKL